MNALRSLAVALIATSVSAGASHAQSWSLHVQPRTGYFAADKAMGVLGTEGPAIHMAASPTAGLGVILETPIEWLSLRGTGERTLGSDLYVQCGRHSTTCTGSSATIPLVQGATVLNLSGSLIAAPLRIGAVRPYVLAGAGLKRYDLGRGTYQSEYRFGGRQAAFSVHAGMGAGISFGSTTTLILEAVNHTSGFAQRRMHPDRDMRSLSETAINTLKHDVFFTIGLSVPILNMR